MAEFVFKPLHELKRTPSTALKPVRSQKTFIPESYEPKTPIGAPDKTDRTTQKTFIPKSLTAQTPIDEPDKTDRTTSTPPIEGFVGFVGTKPRHLALLNLRNAARVTLSGYRRKHGKQEATAWLEHFREAHAACVATFPEERRQRALRDYGKHYCEGQAAQVIAAHTIALGLWAVHRQAKTGTPYGPCLEAACKACELDVDYLPENEVAP